ncbi:MAG: DUF1800 family protein [Alphaproteobacteria bacterium]
MSSIAAFIAANRFGFGPRAGELDVIARDPARWVLGQLDTRHSVSPAFAGLPATAAIVQNALGQIRQLQKMKNTGDTNENRRKLLNMQKDIRVDFIEEAAARTRAAVAGPAPVFERLVHFWSNHFTVSATKRQSLPLVAAFERDVIRPHVLGTFGDMLLAAIRHPAMLTYLDNARSIGPHSRHGKRQGKGLNENLAREILELHTLGVNGGYTQDDVIALAKMLTGWTVDILGMGAGSGFIFNPAVHEPGEKILLGIRYPESGEAAGRAALYNLAQHPSTAQFIAGKLARHFISDAPSAAAIHTLAQSFARSGGSLMDVYRTLLSLPEVWQAPLGKVKTPNDYIISLLRAAGTDLEDRRLAAAFRDLGQVPFSAPSPAGWSDLGKDWLGGEALLRRIGIAQSLADALHTRLTPADLLEATIGPVASETTRTAVRRAGSPAEALTLVFASPEFQRR